MKIALFALGVVAGAVGMAYVLIKGEEYALTDTDRDP
jgi:hypothetical protein